MSWARIDDQFAFHAKVLAAGNEAVGVFIRMLAHACGHLTDGFIADVVAMTIAGASAPLERLIAAGLLERADGGYQLHDFHDWNPPASDVKAKRESERQRKERARRAQGRGADGRVASAPRPAGVPADVRTDVRTDGARTSTGPVPIPSPYPSQEREEGERAGAPPPAPVVKAKAERGTRLPEGWAPSASVLAWCAERRVDVPRVLERFTDYWRAESGAKASKRDWDAAFRKWAGTDLDRARTAPAQTRSRLPRLQPGGTDGPAPWEPPSTNGAEQ